MTMPLEQTVACDTRGTRRDADRQVATHLEHVIRRVKQSMRYRGSFSTHDILDALVARWVHSGEWERLKQLPACDRHLGESVRRFILDRLHQLARRGPQDHTAAVLLELPADDVLLEIVELAELRAWIRARVSELEVAMLDARIRLPVSHPEQTGRILRLHIEGYTQREIALALGISLGLVNKRIAEGTSYLVLLQGIEGGLVR
jgi:DNA-directed RNA polymerase specialized sigma24 family protein